MRLMQMRVTNFSSFKDTGWLGFSPGINLIVGQNNAGKSALLHGFDHYLENNPHRNETEYRPERLESPRIYFDLVVSGREVEESMLKRGGQFWWPVQTTDQNEEARKFNSFLTEPSHIIKLCHHTHPLGYKSPNANPLHGQFEGPIELYMQLSVENGRIMPSGIVGSQTSGTRDVLEEALQHLWLRNLFSFSAQRYSIGTCDHGQHDRLSTNASNLAGVLFRLQGRQGTLFQQLVEHLCEVFSTVRNLSVAPSSENVALLEILVWPTKKQLQPELSFGLDKCGTGVAQVIAILTIAMTFERAVIIIDEISSFLHPAAAKALLRIIQTNYAQHQYFIGTHSPEVLSAGNPATVHIVRRNGYDSVVDRVNLGELDQLRDVADDLGISMTDVFGAERIIWVEGRTEELCFPFIYEVTEGQLPRGLIVTPVVATGDFNAKGGRRELVFQIYDRVSRAASPLVRPVAFSFDREALTNQERQGLEERSNGRLLFLPRRHFECFLLDPAAIAAFINNHVPDLAAPVSHDEVLAYLKSVGGNPKFKATQQWHGDILDENWLAEVDAAALLKETCNQLTGNSLEFSKTGHSLELLQHILSDNRQSLGELIDYVKKLIGLASRDAN